MLYLLCSTTKNKKVSIHEINKKKKKPHNTYLMGMIA